MRRKLTLLLFVIHVDVNGFAVVLRIIMLFFCFFFQVLKGRAQGCTFVSTFFPGSVESSLAVLHPAEQDP